MSDQQTPKPVVMSREAYEVIRENFRKIFRGKYGRDPYELRNPFTGEVFWQEEYRA